MKIVTVVGARPQFIKVAAVSRNLREEHHEILVHTGQHYDDAMSEIFFRQLEIPAPDYNLAVSGGTHGQMTGRMLTAIEEVLLHEKPDALLVYGDTNSTLAGALAAVKLHIPVLHVEAGVRMGTLINPEEVNRVLTDRISAKLFCPTASSVHCLAQEGRTEGVYQTGDVMFDAFLRYRAMASPLTELATINNRIVQMPPKYYYLTCHREENSTREALSEILKAAAKLDFPVVYPVHPRNLGLVRQLAGKNFIAVKPVGYLESLSLLHGCEKVITDSGGLQREAFWAEKQCVTLLEHMLWSETHSGNRNQLSACNAEEILETLARPMTIDREYRPYGEGNAASIIVSSLGS